MSEGKGIRDGPESGERKVFNNRFKKEEHQEPKASDGSRAADDGLGGVQIQVQNGKASDGRATDDKGTMEFRYRSRMERQVMAGCRRQKIGGVQI